MTLDERDLSRLGETSMDLEELPVVPPMDADPEEAPVREPRRRGRRPRGYENRNTRDENVRLATIRRLAESKRRP